jgi:DNA-binding transcriptional LysR family regulator
MLVGNSKEILDTLQNDVVELAIVSEPIPFINLTAFPLFRDDLVVIVHPDHPWCHKREITLADLYEENFISREVGSGTREVYLKALGGQTKGKQLRTVMVLGSTEAVKMAVIGKMGFSIVSRLATRSEVELGLIREVRMKNIHMARDFFLVFKSERNLSVPGLKLKEYLKERKAELDDFGLKKSKTRA